MVKECGEITWFIEEDGVVTFYKFGDKKGYTLQEILEWLKRFS